MTALGELVRISRWQLDEKRRKLTDLERLGDRLRADLQKLQDGIAAEQELAQANPEARRDFPAFLEAELSRRERLQRSIQDVEREIETARDDVAEAFRELKKYELAKANQDARERERQSRIEQRAMDEMGTQLHHRKRVHKNGESG